MSESFDPPPARHGPRSRAPHEPYEGDPAGMLDTAPGDAFGAAASSLGERDFDRPLPSVSAGRERVNAPIVPAGSVTGRSLTLVISIMCFFACLTAGAVYMMNQSASAWL
jgi:cell division transport system permease protein